MLDHFPEPRAAHGGIAAEGALNLLGRPDMDPLAVLIREAVQNSWDARKSDRGTVAFEIDTFNVGEKPRLVLTEEVFGGVPPRGLVPEGARNQIELATALEAEDLRLLCLTDRGTTGLGGAIRADLPAPDGDPTDFVDLVFNIGQPPDKQFGGGTYGFGKTISYLVSLCRTVLIHTRTEFRGRFETRLIAQAVGRQYSYRRRNYTGRHWWGVEREHGIEPLTGRAAERMARELSLPEFGDQETGTTIAILAPDFGERSPQEAARFLASAVAWNFWPKTIRGGRRKASMAFFIQCDEEDVELPNPETTPPLQAFVQALRAIHECESGRMTPKDFPTFQMAEVRSQRPRASLGWLALHTVPARVRPRVDEGKDEDGLPATAASFTEPSHHVALMRRGELVVQYRPGPSLTTPAVEWAGVFKASEEADKAFAESEPPAHDDWVSGLVTDSWHRRYVNVALREIKDRVSRAFATPATADLQTEKVSAALVADALGQLIATTPGTGASKPRRESFEGVGGRRLSPKINVTRRWFDTLEGQPVLNVEFVVEPADKADRTLVEGRVAAATSVASGLETDPPVGAESPQWIGFRRGEEWIADSRVHVSPEDAGVWVAVVSQPPDVATALDIRPIPSA